MLARKMLLTEFDYNFWANGRILDQAALVSEEEWMLKVDAEGRSLHEVLAHLFAIERVWRLLSAHGTMERADFVKPDQLPDAAAMRELSAAETGYMRVLLEDWSDEAFSDEVIVTRWDGTQQPMIRWQMLRHLLAHSMQHRSEAALILTGFGYSPGDIDFLFFV